MSPEHQRSEAPVVIETTIHLGDGQPPAKIEGYSRPRRVELQQYPYTTNRLEKTTDGIGGQKIHSFNSG